MSESHVERKMGNDNVAVKTNKLTELMEKWLEYFRGYCCENDVLGQLTFHILIVRTTS